MENQPETSPAPAAPSATPSAAPPVQQKPQGGRGGGPSRGGRGGSGRGAGGGRGSGRDGGGRGGRGGRGSREPSEYEEEVLQIDRVTRVVKGGRRLRFRATVVVGNKNGKVGIGIGKSHEVVGAIQKAIHQAKKDLLVVPMRNGTLPHEIFIKFKSARILMMPAAPGTGIIAGGAVRKIAELAGIKNMLSKMFGCSNRLTNAQATMIALRKLKPIGKIEK
ncbi:30S ribosomal protein S5 [Candidatus Peregrinibacteria bacterium]|nr:30S ribosomal protein S5 [Candidatus Peregrinibacteria bacterium]